MISPVMPSLPRFSGNDPKPFQAMNQPEKVEWLAKKHSTPGQPAEVLHYNDYHSTIKKGYWLYGTRPNADGVVCVTTLVKTPEGKKYLAFLQTKRPPMKGDTNVESVAGLWGDLAQAETPDEAAAREANEELGILDQTSIEPQVTRLYPHALPTSPGITDEKTFYYLAECTMTEAQIQKIQSHQAVGDGAVIQGQVWVPFKEVLENPIMTLTRLAQTHGIPTNQMLTGLYLTMGSLQEQGRIQVLDIQV